MYGCPCSRRQLILAIWGVLRWSFTWAYNRETELVWKYSSLNWKIPPVTHFAWAPYDLYRPLVITFFFFYNILNFESSWNRRRNRIEAKIAGSYSWIKFNCKSFKEGMEEIYYFETPTSSWYPREGIRRLVADFFSVDLVIVVFMF